MSSNSSANPPRTLQASSSAHDTLDPGTNELAPDQIAREQLPRVTYHDAITWWTLIHETDVEQLDYFNLEFFETYHATILWTNRTIHEVPGGGACGVAAALVNFGITATKDNRNCLQRLAVAVQEYLRPFAALLPETDPDTMFNVDILRALCFFTNTSAVIGVHHESPPPYTLVRPRIRGLTEPTRTGVSGPTIAIYPRVQQFWPDDLRDAVRMAIDHRDTTLSLGLFSHHPRGATSGSNDAHYWAISNRRAYLYLTPESLEYLLAQGMERVIQLLYCLAHDSPVRRNAHTGHTAIAHFRKALLSPTTRPFRSYTTSEFERLCDGSGDGDGDSDCDGDGI